MKAVASRDEIALQFHLLILMNKPDAWMISSNIYQLIMLDIEENLPSSLEPRRNKILDDLILRIHRDGTSMRQLIEVNAMIGTIKAEIDAVMRHAVAVHMFGNANLSHQIDRTLLKNTGTNGLFNLLSTPVIENDRINSFHIKEERQQ